MSYTINNILDKIDDNQIFVPAFQREYVWKKDDAKELIDSLIKNYPFGTMLTWDTNTPPKLKGKHEYDPRQGAVKIILDGQQRITTLYILIRGNIPPYYKEDEIANEIRGLYVNILDLELSYYKRTIMEKSPVWINITKIFKREIDFLDIIEGYRKQNQGDVENFQRKISDNFMNIQNIPNKLFAEQVIPITATTNEAIDIFYKVNDGGIKLTDAELALAQISGYWPEARDLFKSKLDELSANGFKLELDHIIYALLGCLYQIGSNMKQLHSSHNLEEIKKVWTILDKEILDYIFNILKTRAFVDHRKEINSIYAIIPLIVFRFLKGSNWTEDEIKKAVKWFYYSQIRNRYVSQLPQKLDYDLRIVKNSKQPFEDLLSVIEKDSRLEISPNEFERANIRHPLWSMMKFYFKSQNAICLTTGMAIRQNMGKKYQLEWDHIFPWSKLRDNGYSQENYSKYQLAQEITNRAILTQVANRKKSDQPAKDYLNEVKSKFPKALKLQVIPEEESHWDFSSYEDFLELRRKMLANDLNQFLRNFSDDETKLEQTWLDIEDIILNGETQEVEFKQTLRWDVYQEKNNKDREDDIIKCIAAFGNSEDGGILLIGVTDDKEVVGLEDDYSCLTKNGDGNKDIFENHLRKIVATQFGEVFTSQNLEISFPKINEKEICFIKISPINNERDILFINKKNINGIITQTLYIRSGNSSRIIPPNEIGSFIRERF